MEKISKIIEEIVKNLPDHENAHIMGCAIITGGPIDPGSFRMPNIPHKDAIPYELLEGEDRFYLTFTLPPNLNSAPDIDIRTDGVSLRIGERETTIPLERTVDIIHSYYSIRHNVVDIVLKKAMIRQVM
jgi:hypothetical protein